METIDLATHLADPARLAALHAVALLDTPTEKSFDQLSWLATRFLKTPVALVSLVDSNRQFFKSCIGLPEPWSSRRETPLSHSFCQHNRVAGQPLLIVDARLHPFFKDNLAIRDLNVVSYLGIPLVTTDGYVLGSFCTIDTKPRSWGEEDVTVISFLAAAVMTEIHLRTEISARASAEGERDNLAEWNARLQTEIDARKQAEELLRKRDAEMEQFIYTISHDLRSPLVTVKTFTGYLEKNITDDKKELVSQDLRFINDAADKMKLMLDELLEMSRIDRVETMPIRVSLMEIVADAQKALAGAISERKVEIHLPDTDLMLFGDRPRLCQIWQNLIENAVKYCRDDRTPRIELGLRLMEGEKAFFVKDNGIGINSQYHSKIFGIFDKLDPKSPGAGLGLSMVQRLVEKFGGRIWVDSEGDGNGSCFYFTLPQALVQG